jgi:hypothetical protein
MAKQEHLDVLKQGVDIWHQWRQENPEVHPDLSRANLREANLVKVDLHEANLESTDFYRADLREVNLQRANLHMAHLYRADLSRADLREAILRGADLVRSKLIETNLSRADLRWVKLGEADLSKAILTECAIYGISAWDVILDNTTQPNLAITRDGTPTVTVDNLEVAQFVHMLINYRKLRHVLNSVIQRGVLILGRFADGGLELLQSIAEKLRENHYLPMIFDFDLPDDRNYTETVITLVSLSKFVIVDLSGPSVPQELYATIPHFDIPFVPFLIGDRQAHFTIRDFRRYDSVLPPKIFKNEQQVIDNMMLSIVQPAETKLREMRKKAGERLSMFERSLSFKDNDYTFSLTEEAVRNLPFRSFHKTALLRARPLTADDFKLRNGIIQTLEGATTFQAGDYLARGINDEEWPISQTHFIKDYERFSDPAADGFASYRAVDIRQAYQMPQAFTLRRSNGDILTGNAGDYIVKSENRVWVTAQDIFENSHELIP